MRPVVELVPVAPAHAGALRAIRREPAIEQWWDPLEDGFPLHDEPEVERWTVLVEGEVAGMVQAGEEHEPKYRSASMDLFLAPAHQGRGVGTEVVRRTVAHLLGPRGHHRITIDPAAHNAAAIACYAKAGFVPVGVQRLAERDADGRGWHDVLLMELVVPPRP